MRLPNGYGNISKLSGKRRRPFRVRITIGYDDDGKQLYKNIGYAKNEKEALQLLAKHHENPLLIDNEKITFKEVYDKWSLEKYKELSQSSIDSYKNAYSYCTELNEIEFHKLKLNALQKAVNNANGKLPTQKKIKGLLGLLYDFAMANDITNKKYSDFIILGKDKSREIKRKIFSLDEIELLWENVNTIAYVDVILILLYTGLRIGELLDIKNKNVHFEERYIIGGLKTNAGTNRIIPIHKKIEPLLRKLYNPKSVYLIHNTVNNKIEYTNFIARNWNKIMDTLGLSHKPHDTRHTFISQADDLNLNKVCIMMIIGHSLRNVMDRVYTHKTIQKLIDEMDKFDYS